MSALTAPYDPQPKDGKLTAYPVASATKIFKGALVTLTAGLLSNAADAAGVQFAGVAHETKDNTLGGAAAVALRVQKDGSYVYSKAGAGISDIGKAAFVVDNQTVSTAATTNNVGCGFVVEVVDATHVRVRINRSVQ